MKLIIKIIIENECARVRCARQERGFSAQVLSLRSRRYSVGKGLTFAARLGHPAALDGTTLEEEMNGNTRKIALTMIAFAATATLVAACGSKKSGGTPPADAVVTRGDGSAANFACN